MRGIAAWISVAVVIFALIFGAVILDRGWATNLTVGGLMLALLVAAVFAAIEQVRTRRLKALVAGAEDQRESLEARVGELTAELAEANREAASARQAAETANRVRSDFLANISHEVRTPMNAILGMTELALDTELTAQQREYLEVVQDASDSLLALITDVLDFSNIEAGKLELDSTAFSLRERIGDTMKSLSRRAYDKGLELACRIQTGVPESVVGDPVRLGQIIVHLVGNGVKFTEDGEVVLEVRRESKTDREVVLHFTVADTGIGIAQDKLDVVFQAFTQADGSATRQHEGMGLGLAICSRLVALMGGRIWAESEPGKGTQVHFTARFQRAPARQPGMRITDPISLQGLRVLVVDDNATNRRIVEEMVESWGMRPVGVGGAAEAIRCLNEARAKGEPYRLLLSDVQMPSVDGFTLAEWVRAKGELRDTTLILLTSGPRPEDAKRVQNLGIAAYLTKPVKQSELFDAIGMSLGVNVLEDTEGWASPREEKHVLPPLRILVAEDSIVNQKLAVGLLEKYGHRVRVAANGQEALDALASETFDAVLMDVEMPEMDGLEATAAIRKEEGKGTGHVPIIAMTAHAMQGDRQRCLDAGMDDYVSKPIRAEQLLRTLEAVLTNLGRLDAPTNVPRRSSPLSRDGALEAVGGDESLLCSLIQSALEEAPGLLAEIHEAVAERDTATLQRAAHALKGSLRCFGPTSASDRARKMEAAAKSGRLDEAEAILPRLEEDVKQLLPTLSSYLDESKCS
ncbi:MAG: response regulator [Rhodopirellula sp.]|nr:response regulator [Rhodopirellula sp.]